MNCDANIKLVGMNVDDYSSSESESESETSENQESATTITVTSTSCPSPKKRKRPKQTQSFVDSWLTEQQFSGWLTKRLGTDRKPQPFCKTCNRFVTCTKTGLKRHLVSKSHQTKYATSTASLPAVRLLPVCLTGPQTEMKRVRWKLNCVHSLQSTTCHFLSQMI